MQVQEVISYITSPELQQKLLLLKIVFIVFTAFFGASFFYFFFKTQWMREIILRDIGEFFSQKAVMPGRLARQWEKIKTRLDAGTEAESKLAVMEADDLLENSLQNIGCQGENLEKRLKQLGPGVLRNLEEILEANKIRDNIVHEPNYTLTSDQAKDTLEAYEKVLQDIEML